MIQSKRITLRSGSRETSAEDAQNVAESVRLPMRARQRDQASEVSRLPRQTALVLSRVPRRCRKLALMTFAACVLSLATTAPAQTRLTPEGPVNPDRQPAVGEATVFHLSIAPAAAPDPPLEYRLHLPLDLREPGNSVPWWYRVDSGIRSTSSVGILECHVLRTTTLG